MKKLLNIYKECYQGVEDTLYYKIIDKNTGIEAYVFSEYNSFFANKEHKVVGKCFYLHIPDLDKRYYRVFKKKNISEKEFLNLGYQKGDGDEHFIVNSDVNIKNFISQNHIFSEQSLDNIFSYNYSCFDEELVVGVSEPRVVLKQLYSKNAKIKEIVDEIINAFQVRIEDLGLTGSLALGCDSLSDYDIVFYGNIEKLNEIKSKIDFFRMKNGNVKEYDLNWPCRYYDNYSNLICCFFVCTDYDYQFLKNAEIVADKYQFDITIKKDTFSILKAPILEIYDKNIDSIIIFNSGFKGVLRKGDRIKGYGKVIRYSINGKEKYAILCLNPYEEIYNYKTFFNR